MESKSSIGFFGIGNLGYALLRSFSSKDTTDINLVAYDLDQQTIDHLASHRHHPHIHPEISIADDIKFVNTPEELLDQCQIVILSIPSTAIKAVAQTLRQFAPSKYLTIINTSKALDTTTGKRLSEIFDEELAGVDYTYSLLAGGMIAEDVLNLHPLGADLACQDENRAQQIADLFKHSHLNVLSTTDLVGVEYASALKNIVSIITGIVHGLGLPYGSETYYISRVSSLIANACIDHLAAKPSTFSISRQSWGNDMFMSATGNTRNRYFGVMLGQGVPADVALQEMADHGKLVEGVNTLKAIQHIPALLEVEPIRLLSQHILGDTNRFKEITNYFTS